MFRSDGTRCDYRDYGISREEEEMVAQHVNNELMLQSLRSSVIDSESTISDNDTDDDTTDNEIGNEIVTDDKEVQVDQEQTGTCCQDLKDSLEAVKVENEKLLEENKRLKKMVENSLVNPGSHGFEHELYPSVKTEPVEIKTETIKIEPSEI